MEVIASFQVDHSNLKPGIYVSRRDEGFTTFDIRMTSPNHEPAIAPAAMHTLEHLLATWFRNREGVMKDVVYVGPMGCMTGMYIIMRASKEVMSDRKEVFRMRDLCIEAFRWISTASEVPGTSPSECGNYLMHDLPMARWEASRYVERLQNEFEYTYPNLQRSSNEDGMMFHDA